MGSFALVSGIFSLPGANAVSTVQPRIVNVDPVNWTPQVLDGRVNAVVQIGDTIFAGGDFSVVAEARSSADVPRSNLFAFSATTGAISSAFAPALDGAVETLLPSPDGSSLYVGGDFTTVNGTASRSLARLRASDGRLVASFVAPSFNATVLDLRRRGSQLLVSGSFTHVGGKKRPGLASLDAGTGAVTQYVDLDFATTRPGVTTVLKMDMTPDQSALMVIGNFTSIGAKARSQIAKLDLTAFPASVSDWSTDFYSGACSKAFQTYMRDLDISPDGKYVVLSTTGAYGGSDSPCDTAARFELNRRGPGQVASWVAYTGGDTSYAVSVTGSAVYIGGHFRWWNNPFARDAEGPGAVPRDGLAALDPRSGIPLSWNPGRERGVGVFDLLATNAGLWIGHDTERVFLERHQGIAFFPLAGGVVPPAEKLGRLPNDVFLVGSTTNTRDLVRRRFFDRDRPPGKTAKLTGAEAWSAARGAMLINDQVYTAWSDGTFSVRRFDGTTFGNPSKVNLYAGSFGNEAPKVSGMFFDKSDGRIYYTKTKRNALFWRGFSPESNVVGAARFKATGDIAALKPSRVAGMFTSRGRLYFADRNNGNLYSIRFKRGVVSGPVSLEDSSAGWQARGSFVWNGSPAKVTRAWLRANASYTKLKVDVDPDLAVGNWRFVVQKRTKDGAWRTGSEVFRTKGPREVRTLDRKAGTYRIKVLPDRGYEGSTSGRVRLRG